MIALEPLLPRPLRERLAVVERLGEPDRRGCAGRAAARAACAAPSAAGRPAARRRARAGRTRSRRAAPSLLHRREARAALVVERADLAVEDAFGLFAFTSAFATCAKRCVRSLPFRDDEPALAAADVGERAIAVPLHLEGPVVAARHALGERREHRPVRARRSRRSRLVVVALDQSQFCSLPSMCAGTSDQTPAAACRAGERQLAVPLLLDELVRAVVPDLDAAGAVLALRDLALELAYSSGWSSTCTASARPPGSSGTPFGTAQDASAPSRSSRKS